MTPRDKNQLRTPLPGWGGPPTPSQRRALGLQTSVPQQRTAISYLSNDMLLRVIISTHALEEDRNSPYGRVNWTPVCAELERLGYRGGPGNTSLRARCQDKWSKSIKRTLEDNESAGHIDVPRNATLENRVALLGGLQYSVQVNGRTNDEEAEGIEKAEHSAAEEERTDGED